MAWHARLTYIQSTGDKVEANFEFYDDAAAVDPNTGLPTVTWRENFAFDPTWTAAQMQATIVARGTQIKAAKLRADALAAQFPANTTIITIP